MRSQRAAPASLNDIAERIDDRIRALLDDEIARWTEIDPELRHPLTSLWALVLAGGKRLRPAFCHWAFVGCGGDESDTRVIDAGAGLELLHTFALVHDDVMDASVTRRGMDAVHVQFMSAHRRRDWRGEERRFGEGVAILVGDLAFVYADMLMRSANGSAWKVFDELRVEVNVGQYLDLLGTVDRRPNLASARRICRYKSGKYTVERPLHLGAALCDRLDDAAPALSAFGLPLGEAFQLRDDLLGAFGDGNLTGKPVGDDLREGKPTALVARAYDAATSRQLTVLERIGRAELSDDEVREIQCVLAETGAAAAVEADIRSLRDEALRALEESVLQVEAKAELATLALYVTDRDH